MPSSSRASSRAIKTNLKSAPKAPKTSAQEAKDLAAQKLEEQAKKLYASRWAKYELLDPPCQVVIEREGKLILGTVTEKFICPGGLPQVWVLWEGNTVVFPEMVDHLALTKNLNMVNGDIEF